MIGQTFPETCHRVAPVGLLGDICRLLLMAHDVIILNRRSAVAAYEKYIAGAVERHGAPADPGGGKIMVVSGPIALRTNCRWYWPRCRLPAWRRNPWQLQVR
jgi:hypothetical protein